MTYQQDRDETIAILTAEGLEIGTIRKLLTLSTTLHRLAEATCNGDFPADNGERTTATCPHCDLNWHPSALRRYGKSDRFGTVKVCPECRASQEVSELLDLEGFGVVLSGDPRGCVLKVRVPSGRTNDWGRDGICIPSRR